MLDALNRGREKGMYELWAYAVMPEHVHVVLYPLASTRIQDILRTIKQPVTLLARNWLEANAPGYLLQLTEPRSGSKGVFRFWQRGGGYDRNLRSVADVHEKIGYIHANPVRRELVSTANEYRWSSCYAWESGEDVPIPIDRDSVPRLYV